MTTSYQTNRMNEMHNENRFLFKTLTFNAEETRKCLLFPDARVGSPVRSLLGQFTPTYFQTSALTMKNMGAVNSVTTDYHVAGQVAFSGRSYPI